MNPYQVISLIAVCTLVFAALVAGLTALGVPLIGAFIGVYLTTIWLMLGMQKRAQQSSDSSSVLSRRHNRMEFGGHSRTAHQMIGSSANDDLMVSKIGVVDSDLAKS